MSGGPGSASDEERGRLVAQSAVVAAREAFGPRLQAAYLIGSLAHGGFVAAVSDVDVALILRGEDAGDHARMEDVGRAVVERDGSALARRLSLFWSSAESLAAGRPAGRLAAVDWLDLVVSGELAEGVPLPAATPRPDAALLVEESAAFAVRKWRDDAGWAAELLDAEGLVRSGRRAASKAVLFPVRFLYTLHTGRAGSTDAAVAWYVRQPDAAARDLAQAAYRWRVEGFGDHDESVLLLQRQIVPLYRQFADEYRPKLARRGLDRWAADLGATVDRLELAARSAPAPAQERNDPVSRPAAR